MKFDYMALITLIPGTWGTGKAWFFSQKYGNDKISLWVERVLGLIVITFSLLLFFKAI